MCFETLETLTTRADNFRDMAAFHSYAYVQPKLVLRIYVSLCVYRAIWFEVEVSKDIPKPESIVP